MDTMIVLNSPSRGRDVRRILDDCIKKYGKVPTEIVISPKDEIFGTSDVPILRRKWALNGFVYLVVDAEEV